MQQLRKKRRDNRLNIRLIFISFLLVLSVIIIVTLFARRHPPEYYDRTEFLMGTYVTIVVASEEISPVKLSAAGFQEMKRVEAKFARDYGSVTSMINEAPVGEFVAVDDETAHIIRTALSIGAITNGSFDFTIGEVMNLWGFSSSNSERNVPDAERLMEALRRTGYTSLELLGNDGWFIKKSKDLQIDLSGIVKGYAVDAAISLIRELDGSATGYVDAGGDIGIIGPKYGTRPWTIGIRHPRSERADQVFDVVYLLDGAIATSGDYENYFIEDGKHYHHIIDPSTGFPADSGVISATVVANSVMVADAFATAAFVLGKTPGITFFPRNGALAFLIMNDLSVFRSEGFEVYQKK